MSSAYLWQDRKTGVGNGSGGAVQSNSLVRLGKRGVPPRLVERRERVHPVHLGPRDRDHLGGGVELHRAGTERDHRRRERQIARLQFFEVAQHLRLGVVPGRLDGRAYSRVGRQPRHEHVRHVCWSCFLR